MTNFARSIFLLLVSVFAWCSTYAAEARKVVIPKSTGVTQGHLKFPSPFISGHTHFGIDIDAACGDEIFPLLAGEVIRVSRNTNGLGFAAMMKHPKRGRNGGDLYTIYLHMQSTPKRTSGWVSATESIGNVGATGATGGACHTHFEIRNFFKPEVAGGGWYHEQARSCSTGSLNIYACGDQRNASWALSSWENPETYQAQQAFCDPSKDRCSIRANGPIGWFPPVNDCQQASQWFNMATVNGEKTVVGSTTRASCPQMCYAN